MTHAKYSPPVDPLNLILGSLKISARQSFNSGDNLTVSHLCPLRRNSAVAKLDLLGGGGGEGQSRAPIRTEMKTLNRRAARKAWALTKLNVPAKLIGVEGGGDSAPLGPSPCYGTEKVAL